MGYTFEPVSVWSWECVSRIAGNDLRGKIDECVACCLVCSLPSFFFPCRRRTLQAAAAQTVAPVNVKPSAAEATVRQEKVGCSSSSSLVTQGERGGPKICLPHHARRPSPPPMIYAFQTAFQEMWRLEDRVDEGGHLISQGLEERNVASNAFHESTGRGSQGRPH